MDGLFAEQFGQRPAQRILRLHADEALQVGAGAGDDPVGAHRDQEAEILDVAQNVDRLALTIGEVDLFARLKSIDHQNRRNAAQCAGGISQPS